MIAAVLALTFCTCNGLLLALQFDEKSPIRVLLAEGLCLGFALASLACFVASCYFGVGTAVSATAFLLEVVPAAALLHPQMRRSLFSRITAVIHTPRSRPRLIILRAFTCLALAAVVVGAFSAAMFRQPDGLYTAAVNNLGDLPFHLKVITSFSYGANLPPEHPLYTGSRFAYPFLTDFASAALVSLGSDLRTAMLMPSIALLLAALVLLHHWTFELTGCEAAAAWIAPLLFIFSGGLGWIEFAQELLDAGPSQAAHLFSQLPHEYTIGPNSIWRWGNSLTTLFIPQRSLVLSVPLAICVVRQWWLAAVIPTQAPSQEHSYDRVRRIIAAGGITGLLPLVHTHTFLVLMFAAGCLAVLAFFHRYWLIFLVTGLLTAAPALLWTAGALGGGLSSFFGWSVGWDHGSANVVWFWFLNTGLLIPVLAIVALCRWPTFPAGVLYFYLPFAFCFLLANLFRFAPWIWDNVKVLFFWHLASIPLVARFIAHLARQGPLACGAAAILMVSLTLAGVLDVSRTAMRAVTYREFDMDGIAIADSIRRVTPSRAIVLHAPAYNTPVCLTGRRSILGYTGIVWSHGINYDRREADIRTIYAGQAGARDLIKRYNIGFLLVGPHERAYIAVNEEFLTRFRIIAESGPYRLYAVGNES
jgi:hypothetical protein